MESRIFRKSIVAAAGFFGTLGILSVGYSAYSGLSAVTPETPLTVALWTQVKDNFDDLNSRMSNFSFSSGNVGIGVDPAGSKFAVQLWTNKNIRFNTDTSGGTNEARISSTNDAVSASSPLWINGSYVGLQTNGNERMRVDAAGNVGIGTASPVAKLHVNGPMIRTIARVSSTANDDGTDIGQIATRILSVNKLGAGTALRITYVDNLRTYGNGKACRWEIRANGSSCPAMPLYFNIYNAADNPHHSRTLVGYCGGLPAGTHQIQVWVDNAPGYSGSDCYTWWNGATWMIEAEEVN